MLTIYLALSHPHILVGSDLAPVRMTGSSESGTR